MIHGVVIRAVVKRKYTSDATPSGLWLATLRDDKRCTTMSWPTVCCNAMYCNEMQRCDVRLFARWSVMLVMWQLRPNKFSTTSSAQVNNWNKIDKQPYWRNLQNKQIEATRSASATLDAWKGCERRPGAKLQAPAAQRIMLCKLWQKPWTEPRQVDFIQLLGRAFFARTCQKSCRVFAETIGTSGCHKMARWHCWRWGYGGILFRAHFWFHLLLAFVAFRLLLYFDAFVSLLLRLLCFSRCFSALVAFCRCLGYCTSLVAVRSTMSRTTAQLAHIHLSIYFIYVYVICTDICTH